MLSPAVSEIVLMVFLVALCGHPALVEKLAGSRAETVLWGPSSLPALALEVDLL